MTLASAKIKLCGMSREQDILAVNQAKPDFCGFIVNFPKSHRNVSPQRAQLLAGQLAEGIVPVCVTVNEPVETLVAMAQEGVISTFQLHGDEDEAYIQSLRQAAPEATVIKAFRVKAELDVSKACESSADAILLDSGQGSGEAFDWGILKVASRPYILAGGLKPGNLAKAIESNRPWGVDMSSGIETEKVKDPMKIMAAVKEIRSIR